MLSIRLESKLSDSYAPDPTDDSSTKDITRRYYVADGFLERLKKSAMAFASMMMAFCDCLGWLHMHSLVHELRSRLRFGVRSELLPLLNIRFMTPRVARALYEAEIADVDTVAKLSFQELEQLMVSTDPFQARLGENPPKSSAEGNRRTRLMRKIVDAARRLVKERSEARTKKLQQILEFSSTPPLSGEGLAPSQDNDEDEVCSFLNAKFCDNTKFVCVFFACRLCSSNLSIPGLF